MLQHLHIGFAISASLNKFICEWVLLHFYLLGVISISIRICRTITFSSVFLLLIEEKPVGVFGVLDLQVGVFHYRHEHVLDQTDDEEDIDIKEYIS
jgi:hypothetical protein